MGDHLQFDGSSHDLILELPKPGGNCRFRNNKIIATKDG
jgi:hypothetical protein